MVVALANVLAHLSLLISYLDDCLVYKVTDVSNNDGLIWLIQRQIVNLDDEI